MKTFKLRIAFLLITFFMLISILYAQTEFPAGHYWSLDAGVGMSDILVNGSSFQIVIDPKLWISPALTVGSKMGINYSNEEDSYDILTFEGQVYLRWNFLRLGKKENPTNIFVQGGLGLVSAYRGWENVFDDVTRTRGSLLADAALGVTIPLSERWHIEPMIRGGYPHILGASITAGYKFRLPQSRETIKTVTKMEYNEIIKHIKISAIEFVIFGPDIGNYNVGIDRDAQQLNELIIIGTAKFLIENPQYRVRIEGHANPYTITESEIEDLMALSTMRADVVAQQLRDRGVSDDQMVIVAFGGTRSATSEWDVRNRNRRVELMLINFDME